MKSLIYFVIDICLSMQASAGIITFEGVVAPGTRTFPPTGVVSDGVDDYLISLASGNMSF